MLGNKSRATINKIKTYLLLQLKSIRGDKNQNIIINRELSKLNRELEEALKRNYIGKDVDGNLVYRVTKPFDKDIDYIFIEDVVSGWKAENYDLSSGSKFDVQLDVSGESTTTIIVD